MKVIYTRALRQSQSLTNLSTEEQDKVFNIIRDQLVRQSRDLDIRIKLICTTSKAIPVAKKRPTYILLLDLVEDDSDVTPRLKKSSRTNKLLEKARKKAELMS